MDASIAGQSELAIAWSEEARRLRSDPNFLADVEVARSRARGSLGQADAAFQGFVRAAKAVCRQDPRRAAGLFAEATIWSAIGGNISQAVEVVTWAEQQSLPPGQSPPLTVLAMGAAAFLTIGDVSACRQRLDAAEGILSPLHLVSDQQSVVVLAQCRLWSEEFDATRRLVGGPDSGRRHTRTPRNRCVGRRSWDIRRGSGRASTPSRGWTPYAATQHFATNALSGPDVRCCPGAWNVRGCTYPQSSDSLRLAAVRTSSPWTSWSKPGTREVARAGLRRTKYRSQAISSRPTSGVAT